MRQSHLLNWEITDLASLTGQIALQDSLTLCLLRARVAGRPPPYLSGFSVDAGVRGGGRTVLQACTANTCFIHCAISPAPAASISGLGL